MKHYVTIYIDELFEKELLKLDATHAFLGLTKDKSPDELDKIDDEIKMQKLKNADWKDFDKKWYESLETNEFNDGFWGFSTGTNSINDTAGKVFKNNHYVMDNNIDKNHYIIKKLRSPQTFKSSNRCTLEISQEQYETLLQDIQKDYEATKDIKPQSLESINEDFSYKLLENNCVTWVIKKLSNVGIEMIDESCNVPGNFMELFPTIKTLHSTFLKFQNIDDNLKSIKGAKAFRDWARTMMDNDYICYIDDKALEQKFKAVCQTKDEILYQIFKQFHTKKMKLENIYSTLDKLLDKLIQRLKETKANDENLKGDFEFILWDKENNQLKMLDSTHNYKEHNFQRDNPLIKRLHLNNKHILSLKT